MTAMILGLSMPSMAYEWMKARTMTCGGQEVLYSAMEQYYDAPGEPPLTALGWERQVPGPTFEVKHGTEQHYVDAIESAARQWSSVSEGSLEWQRSSLYGHFPLKITVEMEAEPWVPRRSGERRQHQGDGTNSIVVVDYADLIYYCGKGKAGCAAASFPRSKCGLMEWDIFLGNDTINVMTLPSESQTRGDIVRSSFPAVALHEFGHALGLCGEDEDAQPGCESRVAEERQLSVMTVHPHGGNSAGDADPEWDWSPRGVMRIGADEYAALMGKMPNDDAPSNVILSKFVVADGQGAFAAVEQGGGFAISYEPVGTRTRTAESRSIDTLWPYDIRHGDNAIVVSSAPSGATTGELSAWIHGPELFSVEITWALIADRRDRCQDSPFPAVAVRVLPLSNERAKVVSPLKSEIDPKVIGTASASDRRLLLPSELPPGSSWYLCAYVSDSEVFDDRGDDSTVVFDRMIRVISDELSPVGAH